MSVKDKNPEIYVRGYSRKVQRQELKDMFKKYGKIRSIQFKGPYSFIVSYPHQEYQDYYDAEQAVDKMHDKRVDGLRLTVEPAGKKRRPRKFARSRSFSSQKHRKRQRSGHRHYSSSSFSESSQGSRRSSSSSSESSESKKVNFTYQRKKQKQKKKDKNKIKQKSDEKGKQQINNQ